MTSKTSPPAPPPPETVDQALNLLLKAMEQSQPCDERGEDMEWKMTRLDRLASCHQVAGEALQVAAQTRAALFRRQRNALIPINQLPSELLSAILIKSVREYQPQGINALQTLAQVAWQWWQTIKSDPNFWTHITPPMERVELQIRKAGILPLRLYWTDDDAFKDLVQRHARRWTGIELQHHGKDAGLQALCTNHFPHLKYLRVHPLSYPMTMSENWRFNLAQCQNLQEVHLPIMPHLPITPSSNSPIHLRTLHLNFYSAKSYSSYDLESLLRSTPQLVELKLESLFDDTNPPAPVNAPIIDLPNLRRLEFSNAVTGEEDDWIPLLAQIRAPRLENLGLQYDLDDDGWFAISGQTIFTALVTWPSASTTRPEDAPLHSVLRNAGPSVACKVDFWTRAITVTAEGRGPGRLYIKLNNRPISNHEIPRGILTNLVPFGLPLDLNVYIPHGVPAELDFWDEVLDATPSLRTFALVSPVRTAREVMDRLSTKFPSSSSTNPRAPHLEKLSFRLEEDGSASFWVWSEDDVDVGEAVKTMLDKRRDIFIQGGVINPPRLVVKAPSGRLFDEAEGRWLDWEPSDAAVPGAEPKSGEGFMWEIWESFQEW